MKIVAVSDLHGNLPTIPTCDLLLIAGDITPPGNWRAQLGFLNGSFRDWLEKQPAGKIVAIAGNHDTIFETDPNLVSLPWTYLQDSGTEVDGLKIFGTPWVKNFGWWSFMTTDEGLEKKFSLIPPDTDIILTHGPPYGFGDKVTSYRSENEHLWPEGECQGSKELLNVIDTIRPKLVVYGHIHEGRGQYRYGDTVLANVTVVDHAMRHVYRATEIDLHK